MKEKITRFEDMSVWQEAQAFAVSVYEVTKKFPLEELYGITSQLRRASGSVSANIAEGFVRKSNKYISRFYQVALGSLLESKNFISSSAKLDYVEQNEVTALIKLSDSIHNQITAILRYFNNNG